MILWLVVCILVFRVKGPYLSFGTLYEDKIWYICSSHTHEYKVWTVLRLSDFVTCLKRYYNQSGSGLYLSFGTL